MPSVRLVGVTKRFGRITALDRVDLEIDDGGYVCVLGPTGSGKTTLLKLVAGIVSPDEGEIYIDGKLVNRIPPEDRKAVYVPQQYALFPHLKVVENVAFGPLARGLSERDALGRSMQVLDMMRLGGRADALPHELSGGMQQRVALARGLASGAKLLLLDEPLGALDARLRVELRYKLKELAEEAGLTAVHVTHDQEEAMSVAKRIVIMRGGRVQQHGTPFHIYNKPDNVFVASFVGGANFLEGFVVARQAQASRIELREGLQLTVRDTTHVPQEHVVVAVREEETWVRPLGWSGESVNVLAGEVRSRRFLGTFTGYEVRLGNGDVVVCEVPTLPASRAFERGESVLVCFRPEDTIVYSYPTLGLRRELEVA